MIISNVSGPRPGLGTLSLYKVPSQIFRTINAREQACLKPRAEESKARFRKPIRLVASRYNLSHEARRDIIESNDSIKPHSVNETVKEEAAAGVRGKHKEEILKLKHAYPWRRDIVPPMGQVKTLTAATFVKAVFFL